MRLRGKWLHILTVALILVGAIAAVATLRRSYVVESGKSVLERELSRRTGADVRIGRVDGNILSGISIEPLRVRADDGTEVSVRRVEARYGLRALIGDRRLEEVRLHELRIRAAPGEDETADGEEAAKPFRFPGLPVAADRVLIENGSIEIGAHRIENLDFRGSIQRTEDGAAVDIEFLEGTLVPSGRAEIPWKAEGTATLGPDDACSLAVRISAAGSVLDHAGTLRLAAPIRGKGEVRFAPLDLDEALRLLAGRQEEPAAIEGTVRYEGSVDSVFLSLAASGDARGFVVDRLAARGSSAGTRIRIDSLVFESRGARFEGTGRYDREAGGEKSIALSFDDFDPSRFIRALEGEASSSLRGSLTWKGTGADAGDPSGEIVLRIADSRLGGMTLREALVEGRLEPSGIDVRTSRVRTKSAEGRFAGFIGFDGSVRGELAGEIPSVAEFRELAGIDSLSGSARFSARVDGAMPIGRAEGSLVVERGRAGPLGFEELVFDGWIERSGEGVSSSSRAKVRGGTVAGEPFDSLVASVRIEKGAVRLEGASLRRGIWEVAALGELVRGPVSDRLVLDRFTVRHGDTTIVAPDRVVLAKEGDVLRLEPLSFRFDGGKVGAEASRDGDGAVRARLTVESADLRRLAGVVPVPPSLLVSVDLAAAFTESAGAREATVVFRSRPPGDPDFPFREAVGAARLSGETVEIDSLVLLGLEEGARIRADGTIRWGKEGNREGALTVRAASFPIANLRFLSTRLDEVEGNLSGEFHASGSLAAPRIEASLALEEAVFRGFPLGTVRADTVRAGADSLLFALRFDAKRGETNRIGGFLPVRIAPLDREFRILPGKEMAVDFDVPKGDLHYLALLAGRGDEAIGDFMLDGALRGTTENPELEGVFEVEDALIFPAGTAFSFERASARLLLDEDYLTVVRFEARSGDRGRLHAWGRLDLESLRLASYDLAFRAREYDIVLADDLEMTFDGELTLRPDSTVFRRLVPHVAGEVSLIGALIGLEFGEEEEGVPSPLDPTDTPEWTCDIFVRAPRNLWVRNNLVDVELEGEAQVRRSDQGLGALGEFQVMRGSYYIYPNEFRIESGEVLFPNPDDLREATIDITAETEVGGEKIEIRAYGGTEDVRVEPTSESGYTEGEILGMLALRARPEDEVRSGEVLSSWFRTLASRVSRQMGRGLGDIGTIEIGTSDELPELRYGNYVSSDLYLGFSQKIDTGIGAEQERSPTQEYLAIPEREVRVEYRVRRSLLVEGEVGTLRNGNRFLNLDLKVRVSY